MKRTVITTLLTTRCSLRLRLPRCLERRRLSTPSRRETKRPY